mmetsp:Transcript_72222/g.145310  ORF Transcript_72222/g.145310 Transcript_72222/m.145310 type:complete len:90 (+) Transcript_72222:283-552(+)
MPIFYLFSHCCESDNRVFGYFHLENELRSAAASQATRITSWVLLPSITERVRALQLTPRKNVDAAAASGIRRQRTGNTEAPGRSRAESA